MLVGGASSDSSSQTFKAVNSNNPQSEWAESVGERSGSGMALASSSRLAITLGKDRG